MSPITLYGIPNCDQVKKARTWLATWNVPHVFHDFKKAGISRDLIDAWLADVPWDVLLNKKGTTWRALPDARKAMIVDADSAARLMLENPSIVKRPVLATGQTTCTGFSEELYQQLFKK
jgi:arsenate reductase